MSDYRKDTLLRFIEWKDKKFYQEHKKEMEAMTYSQLERFAKYHDFIDDDEEDFDNE